MGTTDVVKEVGIKDLGANFTPVSEKQKQLIVYYFIKSRKFTSQIFIKK